MMDSTTTMNGSDEGSTITMNGTIHHHQNTNGITASSTLAATSSDNNNQDTLTSTLNDDAIIESTPIKQESFDENLMKQNSTTRQLLTKPLSLVDYEYLLKLETDLSNQEDNHLDEGYLKDAAEDYDKLGDYCTSYFESNSLDLEVQKQLIAENSIETLTVEESKTLESKTISKTLEETFNSICDEYLDINVYEEILSQQYEEQNEKKRKPCDGVAIHTWKNTLIRASQPTLLVSSSMRKKKRTKRDEQDRGNFEVAFTVPMNGFNINKVVENFQNCISSHHHFIDKATNLRSKKSWIENMNQEQTEIKTQVEQFSKALIHEKLNETLNSQKSHDTRATNGTSKPSVNIKHSKLHQISKDVAQKVKEKQTKSVTELDNTVGGISSVLSDRMNSFWKKHEKEISEKRKRKKKEEEEKEEAVRQQRKLNFLLSQTELYSHFMSKKSITSAVTSDDSTEENAAQSALQASQRQKQFTEDFDKEIEKYRTQSSMEDENIIEAGDETMQEPNIFNGSLKKYQLKGMKWLVSLYEQGINGILAE